MVKIIFIEEYFGQKLNHVYTNETTTNIELWPYTHTYNYIYSIYCDPKYFLWRMNAMGANVSKHTGQTETIAHNKSISFKQLKQPNQTWNNNQRRKIKIFYTPQFIYYMCSSTKEILDRTWTKKIEGKIKMKTS